MIFEKDKKIPDFLVVGGDEDFYVRRAVHYVRLNICFSGIRNINYERIDVSQHDIQYVINILNSLPLINNRKLIEIYFPDVKYLSLINIINCYIKDIMKNSTLFFVLGKNILLFQAVNFFKRNNYVFFFKKPKKWEISKVIMQFSVEKQVLLDRGVIKFLVMNFENNLWYIDSILDRLQLVCSNKKNYNK